MSQTIYRKIINLLSFVTLSGTFLYLILIWSSIPGQIPTHYNEIGQIDSWGGKGSLWIVPIMSLFLYLLISVTERHPSIWNTGVAVTKANRERVYGILKNMVVTTKFAMVLTFTVITVYSSLSLALPRLFLPAVLLLVFGPIIFFLIQLFRSR